MRVHPFMRHCPHCNYPRTFKLHRATFLFLLVGAALGTFLELSPFFRSEFIPEPVVGALIGALVMLLVMLPLRRCFRCDQTFFVWKKGERFGLKRLS